jgi:hypothetical protein
MIGSDIVILHCHAFQKCLHDEVQLRCESVFFIVSLHCHIPSKKQALVQRRVLAEICFKI